MVWLSGVIGLLLGALFFHGYGGGVAGAALGLIIGLALRSRQQGKRAPLGPFPSAPTRVPEPSASASAIGENDASLESRSTPRSNEGLGASAAAALAPDAANAILERIEGNEARLAAIEARLSPSSAMATPGDQASMQRSTVASPDPVNVVAAAREDASTERSTAAVPDISAEALGANKSPPLTSRTDIAVKPPAGGAVGASPARTPAGGANALWAWLTSGNTLTRVGVVVLFFGVGFLLKFFVEHVTISIEWRLLAVGLMGGGLVALGSWLAHERPAYGLSLQGLGVGILYLTTFAALRFYAVLPGAGAFGLLVVTAVLTVALALRADSQPLAGLAIAGGFLAPFLVFDQPLAPAKLFGYFAVLNGAIFALAWRRAWRALNALGFVFTFALGIVWGHRYYSPQYFAVVEPYLILFFLFYLTIAIFDARRAPLATDAPVDALLVFGVPLVGFVLQMSIVPEFRYGVAISAFAIAAVYGGAFALLRRRPDPGPLLLSRTFLVLAIIFVTIAIPFAVDPRTTSAWWTLEGAAVYWIGCLQRQPLARAFALLVQVGSGVAFVLAGLPAGERLFANASFLGTTLIALAALATAYAADHQCKRISTREKNLVPVIFAWGVAWWIGGGMFELHRQLPRTSVTTTTLAWVTGSVLLAVALRRGLRWSRLVWFGLALLPAMVIVGSLALRDTRTTLLAYGWLVWPIAWVTQWRVLSEADELLKDETPNQREARVGAALLANAHAVSTIALVAWAAWEASEWTGRLTPDGTVWIACAAAVPAIVYLVLVLRFAKGEKWPFTAYRDAYAVSAGTVVAALLGAWFALVNVLSPGNPAPFGYVPLANPLDLTLIAVTAALFFWARRHAGMKERVLYSWLGAALFLLVNAMVVRTIHQWSDIAWQWPGLLISRAVQAALTLTWTAIALPLMLVAARQRARPLWILGAGLLAVVVGKLFLVDLAALAGLPRIFAFLAAGVSLLVIGYFAPMPPATDRKIE